LRACCADGRRMHAGTSVKTIIHWAQAVRSPRPSFRMFDYGVWCLDWRLRTQVRPVCPAAVLSLLCNAWRGSADVSGSSHKAVRVASVLARGTQASNILHRPALVCQDLWPTCHADAAGMQPVEVRASSPAVVRPQQSPRSRGAHLRCDNPGHFSSCACDSSCLQRLSCGYWDILFGARDRQGLEAKPSLSLASARACWHSELGVTLDIIIPMLSSWWHPMGSSLLQESTTRCRRRRTWRFWRLPCRRPRWCTGRCGALCQARKEAGSSITVAEEIGRRLAVL